MNEKNELLLKSLVKALAPLALAVKHVTDDDLASPHSLPSWSIEMHRDHLLDARRAYKAGRKALREAAK